MIAQENAQPEILINLDKKVIELDKMVITKAECSELSTCIAVYLKETNFSNNIKENTLVAKLLGMALILDEENREAVVLYSKIKRGAKEAAPENSNSKKSLIELMIKNAKKSKASNAVEDKIFAKMLLELTVELDPNNEDAMFEIETSLKKLTCDWSYANKNSNEPKVATKPNFDKNNPANVTPNSAIFKLDKNTTIAIITKIDNNKKTTNAITVSVGKRGLVKETTLSPYNKNLTNSMESVSNWGRYLATLGVNSTSRDLVFDPSIMFNADFPFYSGAYTLLVLSLVNDVPLDPKSAISGSINNEGVLLSDNVFESIECAILSKHNLLCISKNRNDDFKNYIVVNGQKSIKDLYVFSVGKIDEALHVMATEKNSQLQNSIKAFDQVCSKINFSSISKTLEKDLLISQLENIQTNSPNFLNVALLIDMLIGKFERTLSLEASLEKVLFAAKPCFKYFEDKAPKIGYVEELVYDERSRQMVKQNRQIVNYVDISNILNKNELSDVTIREIQDKLNGLKNISHLKVKPLAFEISNFVLNTSRVIQEIEKNTLLKKEFDLKKSSQYKSFEQSREMVKKLLGEYKDQQALLSKYLPVRVLK